MKKLLFTIMALSSFVWAEVEEKSDEAKDMVSVDSGEIISGPGDVTEEIEKVEKEEGLEDFQKYISQFRYYEALDAVIKLQKKCFDSLDNKVNSPRLKQFEYAVGNILTQSYLISIITEYALTTQDSRQFFNINLESINAFMDLIQKHPNFLKKLEQAQSNLEYFQKLIIKLIDYIFFTASFQKIDLAEYEKLDQLNDNEKLDFFMKQNAVRSRKSPQYPDMMLKGQEIEELIDKIRQGVNQLTNQ